MHKNTWTKVLHPKSIFYVLNIFFYVSGLHTVAINVSTNWYYSSPLLWSDVSASIKSWLQGSTQRGHPCELCGISMTGGWQETRWWLSLVFLGWGGVESKLTQWSTDTPWHLAVSCMHAYLRESVSVCVKENERCSNGSHTVLLPLWQDRKR